jgi:hypothetical protein
LKSNIEWVLVVIHKYGVSFLLGISSGPLWFCLVYHSFGDRMVEECVFFCGIMDWRIKWEILATNMIFGPLRGAVDQKWPD